MKHYNSSQKISKIELTDDTLTGRGGLVLFSKYLSSVGIFHILDKNFNHLRKSSKGLEVWQLFKQVFCFFFDGTSEHLVYFDKVKKDAGYAGTIEEKQEVLASSHTVKRFFKTFSWLMGGTFRKILRQLFLWRLKIERPDVIKLTLDTMVMNNDDAKKRHGVQPTYKKVKGFQPLQMIWNGKIVDAVFRGGKKNSNYGNTVVNMVTNLVQYIRQHYRKDVSIILHVDAGFYDEVNFLAFDNLQIGFIATGKMYKGVKEQIQDVPQGQWGYYDNGHQGWNFLEFGYRGDSWERFLRTFYTKPCYANQQMVLDFARPDNVILTNIGVNPHVLGNLCKQQQRHWELPETLIASHHGRGADELPHRGLKDFGFERLPFKRFSANSAFYYCMLISFFLFETFKQDVLSEVIPITSYATTVRRYAVDFAAKIVNTGRYFILKVPRALLNSLQLERCWWRCQNPVTIFT